MLEVHKHYVTDEQGKAIAVQIPIEQFEAIERILESSGQKISGIQSKNDSSKADQKGDQAESELEWVDGVLTVKSAGIKDLDIVEFINQQREERIREVGGW
jgi:hypothetical protein